MGKLFPAILLKFKCLFKYVEAIVGFHIPKKFYFKGKKSSSPKAIVNQIRAIHNTGLEPTNGVVAI
jgi:hypothetical protein